MLYSFARVSAVIGMRRQDYFRQERQGWLRLHEKGGTRHDVPAHHRAAAALDDYLERAGLDAATAALFQSVDPAGRRRISRPRPAATRSGRRGITAYLSNGGDARTRAADRRARLPEDDETLRPDGGHDHRRRDRAHRDLGGGRPARRRSPRDVRSTSRDGRAARCRVRHVGVRVVRTLDEVWRLRLFPPGGGGCSAARRWRAAPTRVGALWPHTRSVRQYRSMFGWAACPVPGFAHLISGGKATVAKMFVNNATSQRGLVCQYDVVCFDEISGVSFDQKDGVNILKGYMESGEFSRGKENIRAEGGIVMVGNLDVEVEHQQRVGHLLSPLPPEMQDDTAFMDRIHAYVPGWGFPKLNPNEHFTDHFGLVSDFLSECWSRLRTGSRVPVLQGRVNYGGALSGRDITAVNKTVSGLLKLLYPDPEMPVPDEELEEMVRTALEVRRRVKEQQKRVFKSEFRNTHFSYAMGEDGIEKFVSTPELHSDEAIELDPLPPGQVWSISPGGPETGPSLYRLEVTVGRGSGVKILNAPVPPAFRESVRYAEQNLYTRAKELVGDRDPRAQEFSVQLRALDNDRTGTALGLPALMALCSGVLEKSTKGGLIVVGALNLGGSVEPLANAVGIVEVAIEKGADTVLMPVSARKQLFELSDDMATRISIQFYSDTPDALLKALLE